MAITYYLLREDELAVQEEATFGTSPGALVGGDFFKHTSTHVGVKRQLEELPRDMDRDNGQASVLALYTGRRKTGVSIEGKVIPSGNASTPTPPDADLLYKANLGTKQTATAHTTTAAGSSGTTLNLTPGGGAASGISATGGDLIAVDVSAAVGYEVRRVISRATDVVTVDRAFTTDPASGRTVKVGVTYRLSQSALVSLYLWLFNGNGLRYAVPGLILPSMELRVSYADGVPVLDAVWTGEGKYEVTQATSRPTPTTAGQWLTPSVGKAWVGTGKFCIVSANLKVNNGLELRESDSCGLEPTGKKRTGNNSRYLVEQSLDMFLTTGDEDVKALYDGAATLTALSSLIQIGDVPGNIVAWCLPAWKAKAERAEQGGEVGVTLSGRAIGTAGDDEVFLGFI